MKAYGPPFMLPYEGTSPSFGDASFAGLLASVLGRVTIAPGAFLGVRAVLRGDGERIEIGNDVEIGSRATVHIAHQTYPTILGRMVTIGPEAVVHACTVGDESVIETGAIVLDGTKVANRVLVEKDAVVLPKSELESGFVYEGCPAKKTRALIGGELAARRDRIRRFSPPPAKLADHDASKANLDPSTFVAPTARLLGKIRAAKNTSIWFSCVLDAGPGEITIGENSNIQDNTEIRCTGAGVKIGANTTLGHNVTAADCTIGDNVLVGIGAQIAKGTVIENDALLAAGSETEPGQVIGSGFLWGGRPARKLAELDARRRAMLSGTVGNYVDYARKFKAASAGADPLAGR